MTVSSLISRLKVVSVPSVPSQNLPLGTKNIGEKSPTSLGESALVPNVPSVPSEKQGGQATNTEAAPVAPVWTAPAQPVTVVSAVVAMPAMEPEPEPAPAQTWRQHDKADQAHYWSCAQCKAVVVQRQPGDRCPEGQRLSDAYIEAATREGRFIGAHAERKRQNR